MAKYAPIRKYLGELNNTQKIIGFHKIEKIIGNRLPPAAYKYREWWSNEDTKLTRHVHAKLWKEAGWEVEKVDLEGEAVIFRRKRS